jgi:hypothetical protein
VIEQEPQERKIHMTAHLNVIGRRRPQRSVPKYARMNRPEICRAGLGRGKYGVSPGSWIESGPYAAVSYIGAMYEGLNMQVGENSRHAGPYVHLPGKGRYPGKLCASGLGGRSTRW